MSEILLDGGFINKVSRTNGTVLKRFDGEAITHIPTRERYLRERNALKNFQGTSVPVPSLNSWCDISETLTFGYIDHIGPLDIHLRDASIEVKREILLQAGKTLKDIHIPVGLEPRYMLSALLKKAEHALYKAQGILSSENISHQQIHDLLKESTGSNAASEAGVAWVHRDYWLNNILHDGASIKAVIDWEYAGIGSPYEDFSIVNLWIEREHSDTHHFWEGYGSTPHPQTVAGFLVNRCLGFLSASTLPKYQQEKALGGGFNTNKVDVIKSVLGTL